MVKEKIKYQEWLENCKDEELINQLKEMDEEQIVNSFYKELSFGTGGLRGTIGAGSNRMNVYTVAKASQGLANYLNATYLSPVVCIGYDSRIKSDVFSKTTAEVMAANGIKVLIYDRLLPVPTVSFAVRYYKASAGIMITASHNPSKYNGYKVYGEDGCQITTETAKSIFEYISKVDTFEDIKYSRFEEELLNGNIKYIEESVLTEFIEMVKKQSVLFGDEIDKNVAIVYSPLNGTGREPVTRILKESGYSNITVVKEQEMPDGNFPTCPYPNPEIKEAMSLGIQYAEKENADLLLATDPDCDRVGIAVKNSEGNYQLLSGNETGLLLLDYVCSQRIKHNKMPSNPVMVKTIVTMDMAEEIAKHYCVQTVNVLTGFKFIGEQIGLLEKKSEEKRYIFGFEESYGYLSGTYVRDKDAVDGAYLICEMYSYYAKRGITLIEKLDELYEKYGYYLNTLHSYEFDGAAGFSKMQNIMKIFRNDIHEGTIVSGKKVLKVLDYSNGIDNLPKSDVIKYLMENRCSIVVRPSGTEPKLKTYISVNAKDKQEAKRQEELLSKEIEKYIF